MTSGKMPHQPNLGYALKQTQHVLRKNMENRLRPHGLNVAQYAVLNALDLTPDLSNADLAKSAFVTAQSMQGIVSKLEQTGLIQRSPDKDHGRRKLTKLTSKGAETLANTKTVVAEVEQILFTAIAPFNIEDIEKMLERCREALAGNET